LLQQIPSRRTSDQEIAITARHVLDRNVAFDYGLRGKQAARQEIGNDFVLAQHRYTIWGSHRAARKQSASLIDRDARLARGRKNPRARTYSNT